MEMDGRGEGCERQVPLTLQPFNSCHWNVPLRVREMAALWPFESLIIEIKDNWDVSWPGPCAKHLWVVFGVCFVAEFWEGRRCVFKCWHLLRQTGKHSATLLDWNGNSAPPLTAKTMHCVARCFRSFGVPGCSFYVSARAHSRLCFCVNKATEFILGWNTGTMGEVMRKWGNLLSPCHSLAHHIL